MGYQLKPKADAENPYRGTLFIMDITKPNLITFYCTPMEKKIVDHVCP